MAIPIQSCVICGSHEIESQWTSDRHVTTTCRACGRVVRIEFDPPDAPDIRGRIELIFDPHDADTMHGRR